MHITEPAFEQLIATAVPAIPKFDKAPMAISQSQQRTSEAYRFSREKQWHNSCSCQAQDMSRHRLKIFLVSLVSFVLLYYGVAWAILRCFHMETHENYQLALDTDERVEGFNLTSPNYVHEYLDCMGSSYHTESLAGSPTPSELLRQIHHVAAQGNVLLPLSTTPHDQALDVWLNAVFDKVSSPPFSINLPRYLSLSVLRV